MQTSVPNRFKRSDMLVLTAEHVQYDLAESVSPDLRLSDLFDSSDRSEMSDIVLSYGTADGNRQLRETIAQKYENVSADEVVITQGGMQALYLLGQIFTGNDANVVIRAPSFPLARTAMQTSGLHVNIFKSEFKNAYQLDIDSLSSQLSDKTRLVCLESPHNPSGVSLDACQVDEVLKVIDQVCPDAFLLIDETYLDATYSDAPRLSSVAKRDPRILVISSLSKAHGAPGLRIGWLISSNRQLLEQLINGKYQSIIANSTLDEFLALRVIQYTNKHRANIRALLSAGRDLVRDCVEKNKELIEWVEPHAGALCCVALKPERLNSLQVEDFYQKLTQRSVRVAPGNWFGDDRHVFRLGFGYLPFNETKKALEELENALLSAID